MNIKSTPPILDKPGYTVLAWSGGKDSTASIIIAKWREVRIDKVIISLPMFDQERRIYADHPRHVEWVFNRAKPTIESWGFPVQVVTGEHDYLYWFNRRKYRSKYPEQNGLKYGFVIPGMCKMNGEKVNPIRKALKHLRFEYSLTMIEGIAADEPERINRMIENRGSRSLLADFGVTEKEAFEICSEYDLLSPVYNNGRKRQGCWFCPNQSIAELADLKLNYPAYYHELEVLGQDREVATRCFSHGRSWAEIDMLVCQYIEGGKNNVYKT